MPDDIDLGELGDDIRRQLQGLAPGNVERVGAHLVMAGRLIEDDTAAALLHAQAARRSGGRIGAVREAAGVAAYRAGAYAEAVSELRAARRLTGRWDLLALEADAERALGRPQRALTLARSPQVRSLPESVRNELAIVASGARIDLGQPRAAVALLAPLVNRDRPGPDAVRLWYAYAAALLAAGHGADAREWFEIVALLDEDSETDAAERAAALGARPVVVHETIFDEADLEQADVDDEPAGSGSSSGA